MYILRLLLLDVQMSDILNLLLNQYNTNRLNIQEYTSMPYIFSFLSVVE